MDLIGERLHDGRFLLFGELDGEFFLDPADRFFGMDGTDRLLASDQAQQIASDTLFVGEVEFKPDHSILFDDLFFD